MAAAIPEEVIIANMDSKVNWVKFLKKNLSPDMRINIGFSEVMEEYDEATIICSNGSHFHCRKMKLFGLYSVSTLCTIPDNFKKYVHQTLDEYTELRFTASVGDELVRKSGGVKRLLVFGEFKEIANGRIQK